MREFLNQLGWANSRCVPALIVPQSFARAFKKVMKCDQQSKGFEGSRAIRWTLLAFQENESKIITNLMRFEQVLTRDIMTPRMVVKAAPSNTKIQDFFEANRPLRFSRIPIYEDRIDNVTGFILKDRLLTNIINEEGQSALKEIEREILIVHESMPIPKLFQKLMTEREHIALVVDEFGGMEGIVTMEDVIETLLGTEIVDEYDNIEDMQALARKNWEARAKKLGILTVDEFDNKVGDEEEIK